MKSEIKKTGNSLPEGDLTKKNPKTDSMQRREALKRIACIVTGGITGATMMSVSCEYSDYSDYYDYYSNYYSRYSNYYYDYYSVYSVYWDS